jgi:hypothetical protein
MKRLLLLAMSFPMLLYGQQAVLSASGAGSGSGGTSSFSVGQVAGYSYNGAGPSMNEGVQQIFEELNSLPIELLYFKAEVLKGSEVGLSWETASELNNDYFKIERSQSGFAWDYVGKVPGVGTTTERQSYSYVDESPYQGLSYYRLKQTDHDGSFSYSQIRPIRMTDLAFRIYPNPFDDYVVIEMADYPVEYQITDYSGKLLKSGIISDSQAQLDISDLVSGVYTLSLMSQEQTLLTRKLIKL